MPKRHEVVVGSSVSFDVGQRVGLDFGDNVIMDSGTYEIVEISSETSIIVEEVPTVEDKLEDEWPTTPSKT